MDYPKPIRWLRSLCTSNRAWLNCHQPLARSPAASPPFSRERASARSLPPAGEAGQEQECQHSEGIAAHARCHTSPKQHTWDHKYHLIYIILQDKGDKEAYCITSVPSIASAPRGPNPDRSPATQGAAGWRRGASPLPARPRSRATRYGPALPLPSRSKQRKIPF